LFTLIFREKDNLINHIESKFISKIANIAQTEGTASGIDPPKKVPFVPYAYQTTMSRAAIRSHPILKEFHEFLINETELVNLDFYIDFDLFIFRGI
jgi:hypothetical protein